MGQLDTSKNPWEVNLSPTTSSQSKTLYTGGTILDRDIKVTVDGVGQTNLTAANIKNGVTVNITNGNGNIYSVTGTHAGEAHSAASTGTSASGTKVSTITPGTTTQYVNVTAGATDAKYWEISGSSNLTAANIKKDVTIFGVTGTYNNEAHSSYTPSSTYFQDSNSSGVASTTAVIEANKYATKAYYLKAGTAGAVSGGGLSGSNVTLGDTNNGIAVTRADASYSITTAGWISNAGSKLSSGSKYISAMTIPENVTFNGITMTAGTIGSDSKQKYTTLYVNSANYTRMYLNGAADTDADIYIRGNKGAFTVGDNQDTYLSYLNIGTSNSENHTCHIKNLRVGSTSATSRTTYGYVSTFTLRGYNTNASYPDYIATLNVGTDATNKNAKINTLNNYGTIGTLTQTGTITTLSGNQTISKLSGTITATANSATTGNVNINAYNSSSSLTGSKAIVVNGKWSDTALASLDSNLTAANIKSGVSIFGITGTHAGEGHSSYTPSSTYFTSLAGSVTGLGLSDAKIEASKYAASDYYIKRGATSTPSNATALASTNTTLSGTELTVQASVTPSVTAGWVSSGTAGAVKIKGTVPAVSVFGIDPSTESQTIQEEGKLLSSVQINAMPAGSLSNQPADGVTYAENTDDSTSIEESGMLYINEGYLPNMSLSIEHLAGTLLGSGEQMATGTINITTAVTTARVLVNVGDSPGKINFNPKHFILYRTSGTNNGSTINASIYTSSTDMTKYMCATSYYNVSGTQTIITKTTNWTNGTTTGYLWRVNASGNNYVGITCSSSYKLYGGYTWIAIG